MFVRLVQTQFAFDLCVPITSQVSQWTCELNPVEAFGKRPWSTLTVVFWSELDIIIVVVVVVVAMVERAGDLMAIFGLVQT